MSPAGKLPVTALNYSLHPVTADICQGQKRVIVVWYQGMWSKKVKNYQYGSPKTEMRV